MFGILQRNSGRIHRASKRLFLSLLEAGSLCSLSQQKVIGISSASLTFPVFYFFLSLHLSLGESSRLSSRGNPGSGCRMQDDSLGERENRERERQVQQHNPLDIVPDLVSHHRRKGAKLVLLFWSQK